MSEFDYTVALAAAIEAAHAAAAVLREDFHRPEGPRGAIDHAEADEPAEWAVREILLERFPCAYLGEETGSAGDRGDRHRWLVDPNDGTRSYLKGIRGSSVSIGLLRDGIPVLGVVFAFGFPDDTGDLIAWAEGTGPIRRNGKAVEFDLSGQELGKTAIVLVSRDADLNPAANLRCVSPGRFVKVRSVAYRLALVAVGEGVAQVSLSGPGAWDYGAGHALVRAAGGTLVDERGEEVRYGPGGQSRVRRCFGGAPAVVRVLHDRPWEAVFGQAPAHQALPEVLVRGFGAPQRRPDILSRAQGCLLGQFAGDSLGALVEFGPKDGPADDLRDGGTFDLLAGQPTDDSELALALARALLRQRGFDSGAVLQAYLAWFGSEPFDVGGTIRKALSFVVAKQQGRVAAGATGDTEAGRGAGAALSGGADSWSKANGALMRISPVGIFAAGRPELAAQWARHDAALTHPNPVCLEASAAFAAAIAHAIAHGDPHAAYQAALAANRNAEVTDVLEAALLGPPTDFRTHAGLVTIALGNAFHQLLHATSLDQALRETVAAGGDTDTNAAIAGALLGALHGREAIPDHWRRLILACRPLPGSGTGQPRPPEYWPVDALDLAEALLVAGS